MPEDFEHRRATTTDAQTLSTLATQVFLDTYATQGIDDALAREVATVYAAEVFERRLRDADVELLLVTSGGYTVGFVDIAFATHCPVPGVRGAEVFRLYVQRPFLRRGLGRALMAKAEASARARGSGGHLAHRLGRQSRGAGVLPVARLPGHRDDGVRHRRRGP